MSKTFSGAIALSAATILLSGSAAQAQTSASAVREPPPPQSLTPTGVALWRTSYVDEHGAVPIGANDKGVEYGMGGSFSITPAGTVKGWLRWEQFAPTTVGDAQTRSFTQLVEVDCQGGRGRLLALDLYPYNNLQGEARHVDAQAPEWTYARPGTVLEQNVKIMCGAASALVRQAVAQASASTGSGPSLSTSSLIEAAR